MQYDELWNYLDRDGSGHVSINFASSWCAASDVGMHNRICSRNIFQQVREQNRVSRAQLSFDEFTKKFAGGAGEVVVAYGVKGPASGNRKTSKKPGTIAHEVGIPPSDLQSYVAPEASEPANISCSCSLLYLLRSL